MTFPGAALVVEDVHVRRGARDVLAGVSLRVDAGEAVLVVGANGSGRSTLVSALAGLLPRSGVVSVAGRRVAASAPADAVRAGLVAVPERRQLFPHLSVEDHLVLGFYAVGPRLVRAARRRVEASDVYERFPVLRQRRAQLAGTLSGGEQQMLAIGRALMSRPSVLILDEPFLGLGPSAASSVAESLADLRAERRAVVLVDDHAARARTVADRVLTLREGHISPAGADS
jgi:branched-chain amino acid transport system ATP-binding protein